MSDDTKALNQARYGKLAQNYVQSHTHADSTSLARLLAFAQPQAHWRALDVATGGGHTALAFAPHVAHVVAYDLTRPMLEAMRANARANGYDNLSYLQGDAERLPFASASLDLVTCRLAQHHFPRPRAFFKEVGRVLKVGGVCVMQDHLAPKGERERDYIDAFETLRDPSHVKALNIYEWRRYCREAGLFITQEETHISTHGLLEWAQRQHCPPEVVERLHILLIQAPPKVREVLQPHNAGLPSASFQTPNLFLRAEKRG